MTKHHSDSQIMVFTLPWTYYTTNWEKQRFQRQNNWRVCHRLTLINPYAQFHFI